MLGLVIIALVVLTLWYLANHTSHVYYDNGAAYPDVYAGSSHYEDARYSANLALVRDRYSCSACKNDYVGAP